MKHTDTKRVVTINDLSGLGKCSLTVAIPLLSAMGIQSCPLPTAVLTNQTGFPTFKMWEIDSIVDEYIKEWKQRDIIIDGIFTGFFTGVHQLDEVQKFIDEFKTKDVLLLVDPVMGDDGETYKIFDKNFCDSMGKFILQADIITPNLTELCLLTGTNFAELTSHTDEDVNAYFSRIEKISQNILQNGVKTVIVTGVHFEEYVYNLIIDQQGLRYVKSYRYGGSYSGTGDIFASIVGGCLIRNIDVDKAVKLATSFLETAIRDTAADEIDRNEGLYFECHLNMLTDIVNREQSL